MLLYMHKLELEEFCQPWSHTLRREWQLFHVIGSVSQFWDIYLTFAISLGWEGTPQMSNDKSRTPYFDIFPA